MNKIDTIRGYAVVFGARSNLISDEQTSFTEVIDKTASVYWMRSMCHLNLAHHPQIAMARTANSSMRLWRDSYGLGFEADVPRTMQGVAWREMMASRQDWGASGFFAWFGRTVESDGEDRLERVTACRLDHISITEAPAYPATAAWLASTPVEQMTAHIRASSLKWNFGKASPIVDPVPNPEHKFGYTTNTWVRMSSAERREQYQDLCAIAERNRTWA